MVGNNDEGRTHSTLHVVTEQQQLSVAAHERKVICNMLLSLSLSLLSLVLHLDNRHAHHEGEEDLNKALHGLGAVVSLLF